MSVALACTWRPRNELPRWLRLRHQFEQVYASMTIAVPHDTDQSEVRAMERQLGLPIIVATHPFWARYMTLQAAIEQEASHVHYADADRLLHWVETRPQEWRQTVALLHRRPRHMMLDTCLQ